MLVKLPITLQLWGPPEGASAAGRQRGRQLGPQLALGARAALGAALAHTALERGCPAGAVFAMAGAHLAWESLAIGPWRRPGLLQPTWLGAATATLASTAALAAGQVVAGPLGMGCAGWWARRQLAWVQQALAAPGVVAPGAAPPAATRLLRADLHSYVGPAILPLALAGQGPPRGAGSAPGLAALPSCSAWAGRARPWLVRPEAPPTEAQRPVDAAASDDRAPPSQPARQARGGIGWLAAAWGVTVGWCRVGLTAMVGAVCLLAGAVRGSWRGTEPADGEPARPGSSLPLGTIVAEMGPQATAQAARHAAASPEPRGLGSQRHAAKGLAASSPGPTCRSPGSTLAACG